MSHRDWSSLHWWDMQSSSGWFKKTNSPFTVCREAVNVTSLTLLLQCDCAATPVPAATSATHSAALTPVLSKWRSMHLSFSCRTNTRTHTYRSSPKRRLHFTAYNVGYFRCHPSQSPLTGMRHLHPDCWVKKWAVQDFHIWLHFLSTPSFLSECRSQSDSSPSSPSYLRRASRASIPPFYKTGQSQCSKLRGADGEYFLQPRSQSILHQLKCCWGESGRFISLFAFCLGCCVNDTQ